MNRYMTKAEWEALPYRDDVEPRGEYVRDQDYRARGDDTGVYQFVGTPERPSWWSFTVKFIDDLPPAPTAFSHGPAFTEHLTIKATERIAFNAADWRGAYGTEGK